MKTIKKLINKIKLKKIECISNQPMNQCKNPNCNWFKHSQVGLR